MTAPAPERIGTAKLILRFLADPRMRHRLDELGYGHDTPVIACESTTTVDDVRRRLERHGYQPSLILIHHGEGLRVLHACRPVLDDAPHVVIPDECSPESTIGMVFDALLAARRDWVLPPSPPRTIGGLAIDPLLIPA